MDTGGLCGIVSSSSSSVVSSRGGELWEVERIWEISKTRPDFSQYLVFVLAILQV